MNMKTYQAPTVAQALAEVKRELGSEAVILGTRSFRKGGLLRLIGRRNMWEVTATTNLNVPRRISDGTYVPTQATPKSAAASTERSSQPAGGIGDQVAEIRQMVKSLLHGGKSSAKVQHELPGSVRKIRDELIGQDVTVKLADEMARQLCERLGPDELQDARKVRQEMRTLVAGSIRVAEPAVAATDEPRVIALIGPTGVGKTTTIAKLAANLKLRERKRVALVTIDSYRIAAVDQLRTYADIIDVPLKVTLTPAELHKAVGELKSQADVVLVDTAGRSQNDRLRLGQLRGFIAAAEANEVHLTLSATASRGCTSSTLERFAPLGPNRFVVTKLDEAATFGMILNIASAGVAISYATTGQDVPDDIERADAHRLADRIVGGGRYES